MHDETTDRIVFLVAERDRESLIEVLDARQREHVVAILTDLLDLLGILGIVLIADLADTVVLGVGSKSYSPLAEPLTRLGIPYTAVGDADQVATAFEAMHSGFKAGMAI